VSLSRRGVLGAALLAAGLSACDDVPLEETRPGALRSPGTTDEPDPDPDADLLQAALLLEATQVARLERVGQLKLAPAVGVRVREARAIHLAHVDLLRGDDERPSVQPLTTPPARILGRLASTEQALAEQHTTAALGAESGAFARVLASMAAAARQQATLLGGGAS
jgi:hypothetical protein